MPFSSATQAALTMSSRAQARTQSPGVQRRGQPRSRSFQPSQKNLWKAVKTRRERSPTSRQRAQTAIVGRYRVEDTVVGRGAYSVVKPVTDLVSGNEYVAKIVRKDDLHKTATTDRDEVMQEVAILTKLPKHRYIVEFIELLEQPDEYLVILECLSNGDLCDAILECEDNRMTEVRVKSYFAMMTEALLCCHSNKVSHRDVKPENMLLSENFELKLTDFGLARSHRTSFRCDSAERTTELVGTLRYAAPELFRGHFDGQVYDDYIADVWSLGVCLYVMLAGVFPFSTGRNMDEEGIRDLLCSPEEVEMPTCCSPLAVELLKKLLQKDPVRRIDIRDILSDPWCKDAWKPTPTPQPSSQRRRPSLSREPIPPLSALPSETDMEVMSREELIVLLRRQKQTTDEERQRYDDVRALCLDMEAKIIQLEKGNSRLLAKLGGASDGGSTSAGSGDFQNLRSKVKQGAQMLNDMGTGSGKRSFTPGSAPRNGYTPQMKPASSSPIASRKAPRSMSPGVSTNMRSPEYGSGAFSGPLSSPQPTPSKPRTLSPRPAKPGPLTPSKGGSSLSKYSRPDSPSKGSSGVAGRHAATRSPIANRATGNSRTATPPKSKLSSKRLTTTSPSRTPPVPVRSGSLASPVNKYAGSPGAAATGTWTKPFSIGDKVVYSNKDDGSQCEGTVRFYGRVGIEVGGSIMIGLEVTKQLKGAFKGLHEGKGYFSCPPQAGLLVPPRECRLIH